MLVLEALIRHFDRRRVDTPALGTWSDEGCDPGSFR